jgi:hypothetical protein
VSIITLTTDQEIAVLRDKHPGCLVCSTCARLLASVGYGGRDYTCGRCRIGKTAVAAEASNRLSALNRRATLSEASAMRVLAPGSPTYRAESRALMGVPDERVSLCTVVSSRHGSARHIRSALRGPRLRRRRQRASPAELAALARATKRRNWRCCRSDGP